MTDMSARSTLQNLLNSYFSDEELAAVNRRVVEQDGTALQYLNAIPLIQVDENDPTFKIDWHYIVQRELIAVSKIPKTSYANIWNSLDSSQCLKSVPLIKVDNVDKNDPTFKIDWNRVVQRDLNCLNRTTYIAYGINVAFAGVALFAMCNKGK